MQETSSAKFFVKNNGDKMLQKREILKDKEIEKIYTSCEWQELTMMNSTP